MLTPLFHWCMTLSERTDQKSVLCCTVVEVGAQRFVAVSFVPTSISWLVQRNGDYETPVGDI